MNVSSKFAEAGVSGERSIVEVTTVTKSLKSATVGVTGTNIDMLTSSSGTMSEKSASDGVVGASVRKVEFTVSLFVIFPDLLFDAKMVLTWSVKTAAMMIIVAFISFGFLGLMKQRYGSTRVS